MENYEISELGIRIPVSLKTEEDKKVTVRIRARNIGTEGPNTVALAIPGAQVKNSHSRESGIRWKWNLRTGESVVVPIVCK